jgi:DNA-binding transcriptional regulator YiaG
LLKEFFGDKISGMADTPPEKPKRAGRPEAPKSDAVKTIRLELEMTQEDFAREIGCTTSAVRKAEANRKLFADPDYMEKLKVLAKDAGVNL